MAIWNLDGKTLIHCFRAYNALWKDSHYAYTHWNYIKIDIFWSAKYENLNKLFLPHSHLDILGVFYQQLSLLTMKIPIEVVVYQQSITFIAERCSTIWIYQKFLPFTCWGNFELLPVFVCYKLSQYVQFFTNFCMDIHFLFCWVNTKEWNSWMLW